MIGCLKCKKPLKILINLKEPSFKCSSCAENYEFLLENKNLTIKKKNKNINFYFDNLSVSNNDFNNKTVYELYKSGYINCVKTLNPDFCDHNSKWVMDLNNAKQNIIKNFEQKINLLNNESLNVHTTEVKYYCASCSSVYNFGRAVDNNFTCSICSDNLQPQNADNEILKINSKKELLNNKLLLLRTGWFRAADK